MGRPRSTSCEVEDVAAPNARGPVEIKKYSEQTTRISLAALLSNELVDRDRYNRDHSRRASGTFSPCDTIPSPTAGDLLEEYLSGLNLNDYKHNDYNNDNNYKSDNYKNDDGKYK